MFSHMNWGDHSTSLIVSFVSLLVGLLVISTSKWPNLKPVIAVVAFTVFVFTLTYCCFCFRCYLTPSVTRSLHWQRYLSEITASKRAATYSWWAFQTIIPRRRISERIKHIIEALCANFLVCCQSSSIPTYVSHWVSNSLSFRPIFFSTYIYDSIKFHWNMIIDHRCDIRMC